MGDGYYVTLGMGRFPYEGEEDADLANWMIPGKMVKGMGGVTLVGIAPGLGVDDIRARTEADFTVALK